jgi:ribosome-interacting GTPase 1
MKTEGSRKQESHAKQKTTEEKVQTLRQVLTELKTEAEESIKDYEPTNPFAVKVSGKIEGFKTAIELVDLIDHLKTKDE